MNKPKQEGYHIRDFASGAHATQGNPLFLLCDGGGPGNDACVGWGVDVTGLK